MGLDCESQSHRNKKGELGKNLSKAWWTELKFL